MKTMSNVIWTPQPRQALFMERPEDEALYGGAAGGGKSDALVAEALRQVHMRKYKGIIIRRTFPQLKELIDKSLDLYPRAFPRAKFNDSKHVWRFPSGAQILFGSMNRAKDKQNYQGQAYDFIGFDELTHFTYDEFIYLKSRNRANAPGMRTYMRATANPGGIGHGWVKERYVTAAPPLTPITEDVEIIMPSGEKIIQKKKRIFIPASVFDNKILLDNDPEYLGKLAMMPEAEKKALLYGDWDSFSGQVFMEWKNDPAHYKDAKWTHVIDPFQIPDYWQIYRGYDHGYSKPFSIGWYAVDTKGKIYRIAEYYGCTGTPDTGIQLPPNEVAKEVRRFEKEHPILKGKTIRGIADPAIWEESHGESITRMFERQQIYFSKGDNSRIAGKMQYHYRLAFDETGDCMFQVFNTCPHFIRTIPALVYSETNVEDINTKQEDHIYDECRYVLMENPVTPRQNIKPQRPKDDPLDLWNDRKILNRY